ncbi:MAG: MFS transporter [Actinocatenispora sp.]
MNLPDPAPTTTPRWNARLWAVLLVTCMVVALDGLDVSMVGVALPSIRTDLGLSTSTLQWVVSGYVLGYGGLLLLGGRAADLLGRRRVFLVALAVFAAASLLGGLVSDGSLLIAARFVKGIAAAFTAPAALSIVTTTFPEGPGRNRALSIFGVFGASGFSFGLVASGLLTEVGWRWTFLLPLPLALVTLALAVRIIPDTGRVEQRGGYDVPGAVTGVATALLLVFTVVSAPAVGWLTVRTIGGLAGTVILGATFVAVERRSRHPLVRLDILRLGPLRRANLGVVTFFGGFVGFQFVAMLYLQSVRHWSPLETAVAFLPSALTVAFGSPRTAAIVDRFGSAPTIAVGVASHVAAYLLFFRVGEHTGYLTTVLPSMLLLGLGFMLAFPAYNIQATSGVGDDEQGLAGGLMNSSGQIGGAVVLAVVTAVVTANGGAEASSAAMLAAFRPSLAVISGISVLGLLVAARGVHAARRRPGTAHPTPTPTEPAVLLQDAA